MAPAKINLHLAVGPRRLDGFHGILSLFQAVSLGDTVTVRFSENTGIVTEGECGCTSDKNTATLAASLFFEAASRKGFRLPPGLEIRIEKRIPYGAGLGGGSSDAAAVLRMLALLLPGALDADAMNGLAARVGSDVPFFMQAVCARVSGRGEIVVPVSPRLDVSYVLVEPGFPVATAEAYSRLDGYRKINGIHAGEPSGDDDSLSVYRAGLPAEWPCRNDFYTVLSESDTRLSRAVGMLRDAGAASASMSGSGSTLFGVFTSAASAEAAAVALSLHYTTHLVFPLAQPTVPI